MIYHVVPRRDWEAAPERPFAPAGFEEDGFVHFAPDEGAALVIAEAFYRDASRPLLLLEFDEERLTPELRWEEAEPAPPPGIAEDVRFPHLYGPVDRDALVRAREIAWDGERVAGVRDPR